LLGALLFGFRLAAGARAQAAAGDEAAFAAGTLARVLDALGASHAPDDTHLTITVPEFVENGAVVPVEVTSHLPGAQSIYIISESNPFPLLAHFSFPDGTEPFIATRIKVAQSCNLYAVVNAGGQIYTAVKPTRVSIGGCGA
jgi:sulfur-oxidizing protein SoxY